MRQLLRSIPCKPEQRRITEVIKTHLEPKHNLRGHHAVRHSSVLGEAVDYSSERVGVEESHRGLNHSLEHGVVERITEVDEDHSNDESCEASNPNLDDGDHNELQFSARLLLLRIRKSSPGGNEEAEVPHECKGDSRESQQSQITEASWRLREIVHVSLKKSFFICLLFHNQVLSFFIGLTVHRTNLGYPSFHCYSSCSISSF